MAHDNGKLNPNSLTVKDAAQMLSRVMGEPISVEVLRADLEAGAPTNADGTISLLHYAAWLVKEMGRAD